MAVYVDASANQLGRMTMCHMVADTIAELHAMADKIGMRRSWFQPFSFPHYDVAKGKRALAIQLGAQLISRTELAHLMRRLRADPVFLEEWKRNVHSS